MVTMRLATKTVIPSVAPSGASISDGGSGSRSGIDGVPSTGGTYGFTGLVPTAERPLLTGAAIGLLLVATGVADASFISFNAIASRNSGASSVTQ